MKQIPLTQGKFALVDDEDYGFLSQLKWCAWSPNGKTYYAKRGAYVKETQKTDIVYMHRVVLGIIDPKIKVDHRDHEGLNNQRYNLREATASQNIANMLNREKGTSKYLGVSWNKRRKLWDAELTKDYVKIRLGTFPSERQAAFAYDQGAIIYHGEFASLNNVIP